MLRGRVRRGRRERERPNFTEECDFVWREMKTSWWVTFRGKKLRVVIRKTSFREHLDHVKLRVVNPKTFYLRYPEKKQQNHSRNPEEKKRHCLLYIKAVNKWQFVWELDKFSITSRGGFCEPGFLWIFVSWSSLRKLADLCKVKAQSLVNSTGMRWCDLCPRALTHTRHRCRTAAARNQTKQRLDFIY